MRYLFFLLIVGLGFCQCGCGVADDTETVQGTIEKDNDAYIISSQVAPSDFTRTPIFGATTILEQAAGKSEELRKSDEAQGLCGMFNPLGIQFKYIGDKAVLVSFSKAL